MLGPLPDAPTAVRRCADALRREIVRGAIAPGERLLPERTLAATLGVDRGTVRTALQLLAHEGLLSVRQGSGYRVRDFRWSGGPDLVPALLEAAREGGDLRAACAELLRVRRWLAGAVLEALAGRTPGADALAAIEAAIAALATRGAATPAAVAEADLAVVRAWVEATGSVVLGLFVNPVERVLAGLPELQRAMYADPAANVAAWRALAEAWRAGALDVALALAAMEARDRATLAALEAP